MSEDESSLVQRVAATNNLILLGSVLAVVVGGLLFWWLSNLGKNQGIHAEPVWFVLCARFIETLMSVGALGVIFEGFLRRRSTSEVIERIKLLFAVDKAFAGRLSTKVKQQLVLNTLKAHLGDDNLDLAQAIYMNLMDRYFVIGSSLTRHNLDATILLSDLDGDVTVKPGADHGKAVTLSGRDYYGLQLRMEYKTPFSDQRSMAGAILSEEPKELNAWFVNDKCVFRHFFLLPDKQRKELVSLLLEKGSRSKEMLDRFFKLSVKIGKKGRLIPIDSFNLKEDTKESIEIFLNQKALKDTWHELSKDEKTDTDGVLHTIELDTYIPKEARLYPYLIRDPHKNPNFKFLYAAAAGITSVIPLVNVSGDAANSLRVNHFDKEKFAEVITGGDDVWVFPNSSIVFRWSL
jgi:hypothetical protein